MKKILIILIAAFSVAIAAFAINPSGDEQCRICRGRGWNTCDGHGWRECSFCGGDGYIVNRDGTKEKCANCYGKKGFKCGYCRDGQRTCSACDGTGKHRYI